MPKRKPEGLRALWHILSTPFGVGLALWITPKYGVYLLHALVATEEVVRINFSLVRRVFKSIVLRIPSIAIAVLEFFVGLIIGVGATILILTMIPAKCFWFGVVGFAVLDPKGNILGTRRTWLSLLEKWTERIQRLTNCLGAYLIREIVREDEMNGQPTAALAMSVGVVISWIISPTLELFWLSIICVSVIDPSARLTGVHYGHTPFPGVEKKTCEGFLGAVLAGAMVTSAAGHSWPTATIIGLAGATGEILGRHEPWWLDDNNLVLILISVTTFVLFHLNFLP